MGSAEALPDSIRTPLIQHSSAAAIASTVICFGVKATLQIGEDGSVSYTPLKVTKGAAVVK